MRRISPIESDRSPGLTESERSSPVDSFSRPLTPTPIEELSRHKSDIEIQAPEYQKFLKSFEPYKAPENLAHLHERIVQERTALKLPEPTEPEKAMLVKTYGTRLSAYLLRQKHQTRADKLEQLSISLYEYKSELENLKGFFNKEKNRQIKLLTSELQLVDSLLTSAKKITRLDSEIQISRTQRKTTNHQRYQAHVEEIRNLIQRKASEKEIAAQIGDLQTFDEELQKEYEGQDPYPAIGIVQSAIDWGKSWFTSVESRTTPNQLIIEYSLSKLGLTTTSQAYLAALSELLPLLNDLFELARSCTNLMGEQLKFATDHPVLASQMTASLAHIVNILSGDETMGAALQTLIYRQRVKHATQDLFMGKKNRASYEEECKHPMSLRQIVLLDVISRMPYLVAAYEGSQGRTLGGAAGYQIAGPVLGPIGGAIGGLAHAKAQEVLAESLNRDVEVYVSAATQFLITTDFSKTFAEIQKISAGLSMSYDGAIALAKVYDTFQQATKPWTRERKRQNELKKAGEFAKNVRKKGVLSAVEASAASTFSSPISAQLDSDPITLPLFAFNLVRFVRALKLASPESLASMEDIVHIPLLTSAIDWTKYLDKNTDNFLAYARPLLSVERNVSIEQTRESIRQAVFSFPKAALEHAKNMSESEAYSYITELFKSKISEQISIAVNASLPNMQAGLV